MPGTFYGRSYRTISPEVAVEELSRVREPGIFIVDDVAFIQGRHGMQIGEAIASRGIKKQYYLETRGGCAPAQQGGVPSVARHRP